AAVARRTAQLANQQIASDRVGLLLAVEPLESDDKWRLVSRCQNASRGQNGRANGEQDASVKLHGRSNWVMTRGR
ncbi:MAG: hypothetical protein QF805_18015, partial [Pirellulaceae bacterium]|nr:hypothetical protein [Pirellulaceae bacterium]